MRFVAVHCVPESVAEALESNSHEVLRLRNQMAANAPDPGVIEQAQRLDAVLLSLNGDFSDIVRDPPSQYGGIISMQVRNRPEVLAQLTERLTRSLRDPSDREHYRGKLLFLRRIAPGSEAPHNPHCCPRAVHAAEFCRYPASATVERKQAKAYLERTLKDAEIHA